jgi:hypothetical protein
MAEGRMLRSIGIVAAGCGSLSALTLVADRLLRLAMSQRFHAGGDALVLLILLATTAAAVTAGSFLAGRMAPQHPIFHALLVGSVAYVLALWVTAILWTEAPAWFHIAAVLIQLPAALLGGLLVFGRQPARL